MVHETDDGFFVISSYQVWRPGRYATKAAARYAFQFTDEQLLKIQADANAAARGAGGVITTEILRTARTTP